MCRATETPIERMRSALRDLPDWISRQPAGSCGAVIIECRQLIDGTEAMAAEATRRFEKSGGYKVDGALSMVSWLRDKGKLNGGSAAEHVEVARRLQELPRTEEALTRGEIGYQHVVAMARSADHVGVSSVRRAETTLLRAAQTMDPGQFIGVVKDFEHRVDADAALEEANRAHQRRYLQIGEPVNGLARIEGQLVAAAVARLRSALEPFIKPSKNDNRTAGQRAHDALSELCRRAGALSTGAGTSNGTAPRPQLVINTSLDTLAGIEGAPGGRLQSGGVIPAETVRRMACDSAITRITGLGELEYETTHASRTIPPSTRRALVARDQHCVFPGCDRPPAWCDGHHLKFWGDGGPTTLGNLCLLCEAHHRKVHEEGWRLDRDDGRWIATPPEWAIRPRARTG